MKAYKHKKTEETVIIQEFTEIELIHNEYADELKAVVYLRYEDMEVGVMEINSFAENFKKLKL